LGLSVSEIVREALDERLAPCRTSERKLPFEYLALGNDPTVSQRVDEILAAEWADAIARDSDIGA
jgi:hypothetical protein